MVPNSAPSKGSTLAAQSQCVYTHRNTCMEMNYMQILATWRDIPWTTYVLATHDDHITHMHIHVCICWLLVITTKERIYLSVLVQIYHFHETL